MPSTMPGQSTRHLDQQEQSTRHLEPRRQQQVQLPRLLLEQPLEQRRPISPLTHRPARLPHWWGQGVTRTQRQRIGKLEQPWLSSVLQGASYGR